MSARPHTIARGRARRAAKAAAHTVCLWLDTQLGRPPRAIADSADWP